MIQKKYQEILDAYVKNGHAAGCAVLLYRDGEELAYASAGVRELGRTDPFTRDTVMLMYSMTKVVTAAAVMTLWDKGILTPETPVCEFFPEFADMDVVNPDGTLRKAENVMRVKHLLTMT
ncbi:MAG: beta-lactamase family protein, partial [Clostridia bacterium]|nr:beta-lactamase family protein [Clostridia bacterium]